MGHRRHKNPAQAEDGQRAPHPEGQYDFNLSEDLDANGVQQAEHHHHPDADHPGILVDGHLAADGLKVHQRHHPGQDGFRGAGKNMHDQIGAQRAGNGEKAPHPAGDIVIY